MAIATELDLDKYCADVAARAKRASVRLATTSTRRQERLAAAVGRAAARARRADRAKPTPAIWRRRPATASPMRQIDRLRLTPKRIEEIAAGLGADRRAARPDRRSDSHDDPAQRPADRQGPRAAGRRVFHLRIAAERDGRRGGDLREVRQRRDPPRRQGSDSFQPGDRRPAGTRRPTKSACRPTPCSW